MDNMVALEMLVDKAIADEVREKGLAEIALRRADAKFRAMIKCKILGTSVGGEMVPEKLTSAAMNLSAQNSLGLDTVRNALYSLEKGTGALTVVTKNMAAQVDGIYQLTSSVRNISYLNTGLSLANTAVDILNAQTLIGLNGMVQIEDQLSVLKELGTKEKILLFEDGLTHYAENRMKEAIPVLAGESEMDEKECERFFFV